MKLRFTFHSQDKILERTLVVDHVKKAIREPDYKRFVFEGRILVRKKIDDGKIIEIVYYKNAFKDKKEEYIVITAYYL